MLFKSVSIAAAFFVASFAASAPTAAQTTLDKIKQRGAIVVGVKADYKPWGFLDPSGKVVGMEIDMAQEIAAKLGVKLDLVVTQSANRTDFMQQGRIDLILATMSDNPQRRQVVGIIDPLYYAGGANVLARKSMGFKQWDDLRGRKVCATQGAYYNRPATEKYGADIVAFAGIPEALNALQGGNCVGFLQDNTLIESLLAAGDPKWADYEMPMVTENEQGWGIAVPLAERDGPYGAFIRAMITDWHKSGRLLALEKKWGLKESPFLRAMHEKHK
jgi:polar amino acid transport system substrate-binding protein